MMKAIHYDAEGDILSVTFSEAQMQPHTGLELSDNIIFYYNPETGTPVKLVLVSYRAMLDAGRQNPIILDGLARASAEVQSTVTSLLQRAPLTAFMQIVSSNQGRTHFRGHLHEIFTPSTLHSVGVS